MFFTYIYRHGWRYTSLAFSNFLLWFSVLLQLGGLMVLGSSRPVYSQLSAEMGYEEGTLMGSLLLEKLLGGIGLWSFALIALIVLVKEFVGLALLRRLKINGVLFLICLGLVAYVITMLYYLPIQ
ncbi:hypothetical protein [Nitrincola iocasae]|uniref:Uncharacterized protein n=1 Tax=Nitrincola iocasae TaxID=2614693 RepID=A0A5J6LGW3_9GAMM|nr:hypothetical protein [Nitrincola iocasae]QEW07698.1 hypothetical protein F5I99_15035 [Nitrincola iocasae]